VTWNVGIGVPVSLRPPPTSLEEKLTFQNRLGLGTVEFPCGEKLEDVMYKGNAVMKKRLKLSAMWGSQKVQLLLKYFPEFISKVIVDFLSSTGRIAVSNIPGFKEKITIGGYTLEDSIFITPNCFKIGVCILGITYNGIFKFTVFCDEGVEAQAKDLLNKIESVMQEELIG
jgi:hypothetical protein